MAKQNEKPDEQVKKKKHDHYGHRERMRKRLQENGFEGFSDHEILEYMLYYVYKTQNTNEIGHRLLKQFRSIPNVLQASEEELLEVEGIGKASVDFIQFLREFIKVYERSSVDVVDLSSIKNRCAYFQKEFALETDEKLLVVCLDDQMCVVSEFLAASGTAGSVTPNMQTVTRKILNRHCNMVMLAHNHPKGKPIASYQDIESTRIFAKLCKQLGIILVDHVIVAGGRAVSMEASGAFAQNDFRGGRYG